MQLGASTYSVNLSVRSFLSPSKFCVLAPSDVTSKHTKQMKTQTKLAQLGTFCVFSLNFLLGTVVGMWSKDNPTIWTWGCANHMDIIVV